MSRWIAFIPFLIAFSSVSFAHKPSDSFLTLTASNTQWDIQWDIALRDLEHAIGLDINRDGQLTRQEINSQSNDIVDYALSRLALYENNMLCPYSFDKFGTVRRDGDTYTSLTFSANCEPAKPSRLVYDLFHDIDPTHSGLVQLNNGQTTTLHALSSSNNELPIGIYNSGSTSGFTGFFVQGVWHIWIGFDHILFLLTLLLPAVLTRKNCRWTAADSLTSAFVDTVKIVSAFTLAHSATLILASLEIVTFPSRIIESLIALSVLVTAVNNIHPIIPATRWQIALVFGLVHGFGFANVLQELELPAGKLVLSLLSFNIGVEAGQLAIVCLFFPLAWFLRRSLFYTRGMVFAGSFSAATMALFWLSERLLDQNLSAGLFATLTRLPVYSG